MGLRAHFFKPQRICQVWTFLAGMACFTATAQLLLNVMLVFVVKRCFTRVPEHFDMTGEVFMHLGAL